MYSALAAIAASYDVEARVSYLYSSPCGACLTSPGQGWIAGCILDAYRN
jgi:hypothetical protein